MSLLPICFYRDFAETVAYVNLRSRSLAEHDFGRARTEQGLNLERRHLNVLVLGMRYPRFDEVVVQGRADRVGLGDWLARQVKLRQGAVSMDGSGVVEVTGIGHVY